MAMKGRQNTSPEAPPSLPRKSLIFGPFRFDPVERVLFENGTQVDLPPRVLAVLMCLLERPNELVSKETLLDAGWKDVEVTEQSLAEAVGTLRRILGDDPKNPEFIQTVHRRGYRFVAPVTTDGSGAVEAAAPRVSPRRYGLFLTLALVLVFLAVAGILYIVNRSPTPIPFEERDWVLIADFENRTGEPEFDHVLSHALEWELSSSRFVNVAPPGGGVGDTLQLMRKPPDTPISEDIGREVCIRDGRFRALISGRIEKLGSTYVLSAKLIDPPTATTVAAVSEDATDEDRVHAAVRRLSKQLRMTLGENLAQLTESEIELEKVTTPSLRALRLFSQGMAFVNLGKWEPAAELLARSVAEDPGFATAHIYLAHCYSNLRRHDEAAPHYQQAFALADRTTEQERYFILGSYYYRVLKDYEKAITSWEALIQIEPDHYWGVNNLGNTLSRIGRYQESVRYSLRRAELRPNSDINNLWAAQALAVKAQDLDAAKPYAERARKLRHASEEKRPHPNWMAWIDFLPAFEMWLMNDPAKARGAVEEIEDTISAKTGEERESYIDYAGIFYLTFGMANQAEKLFRTHPEHWFRESRLALVALARDDRDSAKEHLKRSFTLGATSTFRKRAQTSAILAVLANRSGLGEEARSLESLLENIGHLSIKTVKGELALARGEISQSISMLQEGVDFVRPTGRPQFYLGSEALAEAWEKSGNLEQAIAVLEQTSENRSRANPYSSVFWMDCQLRLAKLYRRCGRVPEAQEIESELRVLLKLADPDHTIVRELGRLESPTSDSAS